MTKHQKHATYFGVLFLVLLVYPFSVFPQEKFYNYYDKGLAYMKTGDWVRAIEEFKSTSSLEFEDTKKKRTYGTRFIKYFPHREMGIAYYNLGEYDNARKELELSIAYKKSKSAEKYLTKLKSSKPPPAQIDLAALEAFKELEAEERRIAEEEERIAKAKKEEEERLKAEEEKLRKEWERIAKAEEKEEEERLKAEEEERKTELKRIAKVKEEEEAELRAEVKRAEKERKRIAKAEKKAEKERLKEEAKRAKEERKLLNKAKEEEEAGLRAEMKRAEKERKRIAKAEKKAEEERLKAEEEERKTELKRIAKVKEEEEAELRAEVKRAEKERKRLAKAKRKAEEERLKAKEEALKKERERLAKIQDEIRELEERKKELETKKQKKKLFSKKVPVGALTYDPSKVTQVGSRLTVAVLPFEEKGMAENMGGSVMEKLITQLVNLRRFRIIDREALDKIMKEQNLGLTGIVDQASAIKAGKIAGADVIILGSIDIKEGFGKVSTRVIDIETSETIVAKESKTERTDSESIERIVESLAIMIYNDLPLVEGYIVGVDAGQVYLDIGGAVGIRKGTKFVAFREGKEIIHPATGEILGKQVTKLSELVAIQVQEKMAIAQYVNKEGKIEVGDKVVVK